MTHGFARITDKPQCVIPADVGTQALRPAIHNASCGRVPVLIFAGSSPMDREICTGFKARIHSLATGRSRSKGYCVTLLQIHGGYQDGKSTLSSS